MRSPVPTKIVCLLPNHLQQPPKMSYRGSNDTVDGRNPAPPWMVETLYQLVQDFFHPPYFLGISQYLRHFFATRRAREFRGFL
jgi:hypothetical protein